ANPLIIRTLEYQPPDIRLISCQIHTREGTLARSEEAALDIEIQNFGKGVGKNVSVRVGYPDNTFSATSNNLNVLELLPGKPVSLQSKFLCNTSFSDSVVPINIDLSESEGLYSRDTVIRFTLDQPIMESPIYIFSDIERDIPVIKEKNPDRFALIFGNENYADQLAEVGGEINVPYAVNDARAFKEYVNNLLGVPLENCRYSVNSTSARMNREIDLTCVSISKSGPDCEIFLFYAGHGLPEEGTNIPYLIPVDVNHTNIKAGINTADLYQKLAKSGAKRITIFLDACFSGGGRESGLLAGRSIRVKPSDEIPVKNTVVYSASSGNQTALPYKEKRHGMFTYFLLKKLKETKGQVTYEQMDLYLRKEVSRVSINVNDKPQDPVTIASPDILNQWGQWRFR
ncbi:MAG TPA: caspase family protein, partial [Bacteroidales bacterium]|nr:caspase family protein [Bacteroidales bacterium]